MKLIVCLDDAGGMAFNRRRQSRDRVVTERIVRLTSGGVLWTGPGSAPLFDGLDCPQLRAAENFLEKAGPGEYCFAETDGVLPWADRIEEVTAFWWNRRYPSDLALGFPLPSPVWKLAGAEEFPGYSHKKITEAKYLR